MANISVSEKDFELLADVALTAESRGDMQQALQADRLARRISAALTVGRHKTERRIARAASGKEPTPFTWEQVPTLLGRQ